VGFTFLQLNSTFISLSHFLYRYIVPVFVISYAVSLCKLKRENEKFPWLMKRCASPHFPSSV